MMTVWSSILSNGRLCAFGLTCLLIAGCAGKPFEPTKIDEIPPGPGLLSGDDGEFVIYRRSKSER